MILTVDVSTNSYFNFFLYQMISFVDTSTPIDGVNYTNNPFSDCSVNALQLTEYLQPVSPDLKSPVRPCQIQTHSLQAIVGCNTTSGKFLYFQTTNEDGLVASALQQPSVFTQVEHYRGPLDVQDATTVWTLVARKLWNTFSTDITATNLLSDRLSFLRYSLTEGPVPLSYIRFSYSGAPISELYLNCQIHIRA